MAKKQNSFEDEIGNLGGNEDFENNSILNEADDAVNKIGETPSGGVTGMIGKKILTPNERRKAVYSNTDEMEGATKIGSNIFKSAEIRDGWIPVDRNLLGERDVFYPETWEFLIRPATVEAIKSWSTIDEDNEFSVNTVFNEILKSCLAIRDNSTGAAIPWSQINSWDRFFFILLIRNYTFSKGESKLEFEEECISCDTPITFRLEATALYYDMPSPEVMPYWDRETRTWQIDTEEFGLDKGILTLYVPTVEKDQNLLGYVTEQYRTKNRYSASLEIFIKYLAWLIPKAPKDPTLLKRKIREAELEFKGWNIDEFTFMEDVIRNIVIMPSTKLKTTCPSCGEEVTADIRFPDGIKSIFAVQSRFKKFGTK